MSTETYYPVNGRITVYIHDHHREPYRITQTALTDLTEPVKISYWKINEDRESIILTIVGDEFGSNAYKYEQKTYPVEIKETPLPSPGRNFKWSEFYGCWVHKKTGHHFKNA